MTIVLDGTNGITSPDVDSKLNGLVYPDASSMGFRNRIINGDMRIDQRNNGAAVTTSGQYLVDRFTQAFANASCSFQQAPDAPTGFTNSLKLTVTTGAAPSVGSNNAILQRIEGLNTADLSFGSASAASVTLSFWVKASVTGTYATSLTNSAFNRSYVATYQINAANTWEQKTVTITGDTTGTWLTTNGTGIVVLWDFGSGSNLNTTAGSWQAGNFYRTSSCTTIAATTNATFQITGVQLEAGTVASPFERRDYGRELMMAQRYFQTFTAITYLYAGASTTLYAPITWAAMRATPTGATPTQGLYANTSFVSIAPSGPAGGRINVGITAAGAGGGDSVFTLTSEL